MHEFEVVSSLLTGLKPLLAAHHVGRVTEIHLRGGSDLSQEAVRAAYDALTEDSILEGAELTFETDSPEYECSCGYRQVVTPEDLVGNVFNCPLCGRNGDVDQEQELELVDVIGERAELEPVF